ncbi:hypothetical protein [Acidicapsa acidisoli]|uniref:hypothetical protein n=1 Tax=Acidicapsa acidisoli TaxID=1615681 RepID=UPI0021E0CD9F|nr:hypothetical protein [Acidicapsa acidisoli]
MLQKIVADQANHAPVTEVSGCGSMRIDLVGSTGAWKSFKNLQKAMGLIAGGLRGHVLFIANSNTTAALYATYNSCIDLPIIPK